MTSLMCVVKRLHMFDPQTTFAAESAPLLVFHIPYWVCNASRYGHAVADAHTSHRTKSLSDCRIQSRMMYTNALISIQTPQLLCTLVFLLQHYKWPVKTSVAYPRHLNSDAWVSTIQRYLAFKLDNGRLFRGLRLLLLPRPTERRPKCLCPDT